jgi:hypothetical protein
MLPLKMIALAVVTKPYTCAKCLAAGVVRVSSYVLPTEAGRSELVNKTTKLDDRSVGTR